MSKKLSIVWTKLALDELGDITNYWNNRNKSDLYTKKLFNHLKVILSLLAHHPMIGKVSPQRKDVRIKVFMNYYSIIYRFDNYNLHILDFWDNRKDSAKNKYL